MIYKKHKRITLGTVAFKASKFELGQVRSKTYNIVRRGSFMSLALMMLVLNMTFLSFIEFGGKASAATATVLPNVDITTNWLGTAAPHWSEVDEDVDGTPDTADYFSTGDAGTSAESATEELAFDTISVIDTVSNITVELYAQSATNANGGTLDDVQIQLRINGGLQTAVTVTPAYNTWTKYTASFSGSWTQAHVDGMQVLFTRVTQGSTSPTNRDDIRIAAVNADITYVASYNAEQSAYQWFDNANDTTNTTWAQTWGGAGSDIAQSTTTDASGNYLVTGYTTSYGAGSFDMFLTKFDSSGTEQWSKTWGGTGSDIGYSVTTDASGNYLVTGQAASGAGGGDMFLAKFNSNGIEQWSKTWGGASTDVGKSVITDASGNYLVAGYTYSDDVGGGDMFLAKFDSNGIEQWSKTWGGASTDRGHSVATDASGNYLVAGYTFSYGAGSEDMFLAKFDSSGIEQWSKTWGGTGTDIGHSVTTDASGNYLVTGQTTSYGAGGGDMFLAKFNSNGIEQWSKTWGGASNDYGFSFIIDASGNYLVTGQTNSYGAGGYDIFLVKFDSSGIEQWSKTWGDTSNDYGYSVTTDASGSYLVTGSTASTSGDDIFLTKHDANGDIADCAACATQTVAEVDQPAATEVNQNITEVNQNITEANQTVTESDQNIPTLVHCGVVGSYFHTWGGTGNDDASALALDTAGNIYVAGGGYGDQSLVKYDSSGVEQWSKTWGGTSNDYAKALALDTAGNIYVAGIVQGSSLSVGGWDQSLVKYNSSGIEQWSKTWGGTSSDYANALALDTAGNIYVAGSTASTGLTAGSNDQTLVKYNSSGVEQWSKTWGGTSADIAYALALDTAGNIYVAGETNSSGLTAGNFDQTLVKYNSSGVEQWSKTWGGTGIDSAYALALDTAGNIYVAGETGSTGLTAGSYDQTLVKIDSNGLSCGGICTDRTTAEVDHTIAEEDRDVTVENRTIDEVNHTIAEVDRTIDEVARNESLAVLLADVGAQLNSVSQNTATTAPTEGAPFRLRINAHITTDTATSGNYKLQYAAKSGTCDTSFTGETFSDVTTSSSIATYTGNGYIDGATLAANVNDPAHSTDDTILQEYDTDGIFSIVNDTAVGEDALWDIPLVANGAAGYESFCFRIVLSGGTQLNTYTVVPEITIPGPAIEQSGYRWFDNSDDVQGVGWAQTWGGTGTDRARALALDTAGNIYVAGYTGSTGLTAGGSDQTLVKYNSSGVEQWSKTWGGTNSDIAYALALDTAGNIYVAGETNSSGLTAGNFDQTLVKYDSSGVEQWSKTWGGTGIDSAYALALDTAGNIYVAGETNSSGLTAGNFDQTLVKYNSSGIEQWSKTWGGTSSDYANALALDTAGNIYVAGETASSGLTAGSNDQTLVKYDSSGIEQWSKTWGGTGYDQAYALALDTAGNIYVAGSTGSSGLTAGASDQTLVKYDSSGVEQWSKTWGGTGYDYAFSLALDTAGNIYIAGQTSSTDLTAGGNDQTLLKFASDGTIANCATCVDRTTAEVDRTTAEENRDVTVYDRTTEEVNRTTEEVNRDSPQTLVHCGVVGGYLHTWGGTGSDYARALALDTAGNIYVAGDTASSGLTAGSSDQTLVKYNSSGIEQWSKTWGGDGSDIANALTLDTAGNIYVAGQTDSTGLTSGSYDQTLVKYNSSGIEQWSKTWGGDALDIAYALALDTAGNIYVAGFTYSIGLTGIDQTLVKYNSSGVEQWSKTWGGTGGDIANALALDTAGNIYVAGSTASTGLTAGSNDQTLVKYNSSGIEQWSKTWGGTGSDTAQALALDTAGNIYVAGSTYSTGLTAGSGDQTLVKYNSSGIEQWSKTWGGDGLDIANALALDTAGNIYVAGFTYSTGLTAGSNDQTLVKYNSSGVEQWSKTWGGNSFDYANALALDTAGNIYVAGYTSSTGLTAGSYDQTLVKIDSNGLNCGGICTDRTTIEEDHTITEENHTITEENRTTAEVNRTTEEVNRTIDEVVRNQSTGIPFGSALAEINSLASLVRGDEPLRLRLLLNTTASPDTAGSYEASYKLQYSPRIGSCDVSFVGENYIDISTSTLLSFNDNPSVSDATTTAAYSNDPTYSSLINVGQSYEESNSFTNPIGISPNTAYIWDFALTPNAGVNGTYCIRTVNGDGSLISGYNQIVELELPSGSSQQMRHGTFFDAETEGTKQAFYW
jgi:uncharacterized delta-60 repeat protein